MSAPVPQLAASGQFEREVNRILRTAMAKHPGERYPSAPALRDDLRRVLKSVPAPTSVEPGTGSEKPASGPPARTPTPAPAAGYAPYTPDAPASSSPPVGLIAALAVGLVLLLGAGVVGAVVALRSGDGEGSQNDARTVAIPTLEVTGPTGTTDEDGLTADERRAANNIAAALEGSADFDEIDARCTARKLVQADGIKGLQDKGYLDKDLNFIADTS